MLGPNCIGVYDALAEFHVSSNDYPPGPVGLISQSGNLSIELGMLLERCGLGLSRFASIGNQADVRLPDLVEHLAGHEPTRAIAIYAEDVADGRAFVEAARAAASVKPVDPAQQRPLGGRRARRGLAHRRARHERRRDRRGLPRGGHRPRRLARRAGRRLPGVRALAAGARAPRRA